MPAEAPPGAQDGPFPGWVYTMPRSGPAYSAAYPRLDLMDTLPCFCGCGRYEAAHASLKYCFVQPNGEIEPHAAFCETCQDEALDAARLDDEGVPWSEIHARIVAEYADREPGASMKGGGCSLDAERPSCG